GQRYSAQRDEHEHVSGPHHKDGVRTPDGSTPRAPIMGVRRSGSGRPPASATGSPWVLHRGATTAPRCAFVGRSPDRRDGLDCLSPSRKAGATLSEVKADHLYGVSMPSGSELIRTIKEQIREVDPRE